VKAKRKKDVINSLYEQSYGKQVLISFIIKKIRTSKP